MSCSDTTQGNSAVRSFFYMIINATPYRVSTKSGSLVEGCLPDVVPSHKTNIKGARKFQPDRSLDPLHSGPKPGWERRRVGHSAMQQTHPVTTTYAKDTIDFQEQGVACSRLKHETGKRGSVLTQNGHCPSGNV